MAAIAVFRVASLTINWREPEVRQTLRLQESRFERNSSKAVLQRDHWQAEIVDAVEHAFGRVVYST